MGSVNGAIGQRSAGGGAYSDRSGSPPRGGRGGGLGDSGSLAFDEDEGYGWHGSEVIALHCIVLHCIAVYCIAVHCIALQCIALNYVTLQWTDTARRTALAARTGARGAVAGRDETRDERRRCGVSGSSQPCR